MTTVFVNCHWANWSALLILVDNFVQSVSPINCHVRHPVIVNKSGSNHKHMEDLKQKPLHAIIIFMSRLRSKVFQTFDSRTCKGGKLVSTRASPDEIGTRCQTSQAGTSLESWTLSDDVETLNKSFRNHHRQGSGKVKSTCNRKEQRPRCRDLPWSGLWKESGVQDSWTICIPEK